MASNFIQDGKSIRVAAPVGGVVSGGVVKVGSLIGVAAVTAAAGEHFTLHLEGCFRLPKVTADVVATGAALYWDDAAGKLTTTASGNTLAGHAIEPAANTLATVLIRLAN